MSRGRKENQRIGSCYSDRRIGRERGHRGHIKQGDWTEHYDEPPIKVMTEGRRCNQQGCHTKLSVYNYSDTCFVCLAKIRDMTLDMIERRQRK